MGGSSNAFEPGTLQVAQPYTISGRTGILTTLTNGQPVARLLQLGLIEPKFSPTQVFQTPIRISQIRLRYVPVTAPTAGTFFEVLKGTVTAPATQHNAGGTLHLPQRRKTSGYPLITAAETSLYTSDTGVISGGAVFTPLEALAPIDMVGIGVTSVNGESSVWQPSDLCPLQLEPGEALEVRCVGTQGSTGILLAAFDFLR